MSGTPTGSQRGGDLTPGVLAPLDALAGEGPLHFTARALHQRLTEVFPPARFDHQWIDGRLSKQQWARLTRKPPTVALGFGGITPDPRAGAIFHGTAHFMIALVAYNPAGPRERLMGDKVAPGMLAMIRAAILMLNGFEVRAPDTTWASTGAVEITTIAPVYDEAWVDEALSVTALEVGVQYDEALPPGLDTKNYLDAVSNTWTFAGSADGFTELSYQGQIT
jgi:hypothetical protein